MPCIADNQWFHKSRYIKNLFAVHLMLLTFQC